MSDSTPAISVVIPCYNQGAYLAESVASVRAPAGVIREIIVVDDGSTDAKTRELFDRWPYPAIRLVRQANSGLSSARNAGVREATSDFIIVLDSDDRMGEGFPDAARRVFLKEPSVVLIGGEVEFFGDRTGRAEFAPFGWPRMLYDNCIGSCVAFRKSDWAAVGGYCESMREGWEDWDFYLSLLERGGEYRHLPMITQHYRRHGANMTTAIDRDLAKRERLYATIVARHEALFRRHAPALAAALAAERVRFQALAKDRWVRRYRMLRKTFGQWPY